MFKVLAFAKRTVCSHPTSEQIKKWDGPRMYLECLICGDNSPGVTICALKHAA